jgi:anhydro-N-acetylmuramic acid kinase
MSGTSMDGVSAGVVRFRDRPDGTVVTELLGYRGLSYDEPQRERLRTALRGVAPVEYCRLNFDLGGWLADAALAVVESVGVPRSEVRAVATHGHTVWHEPGHSTWQFGEPAVIAERTGWDVISDFRVRDVAAGGQGAPLVPIADVLLFAGPDWRALQNLGGIGNVTVVPPQSSSGDHALVQAFDTGPGVAVIDGVVRLLEPSLPYDVDGRLARAGRVIPEVVDALLTAPYFSSPPPKSTGRELFNTQYIVGLADACRAARADATTADIVATAVSLTARSIADAYRRWVRAPVAEVLLSGGGAKNPALADAITEALAPLPVRLFDDVFFDGEAKEAVAFALLGYLFLTGRAGNVPSATGARGPRLLGKLTPAGRVATAAP